VAFRRNSFTTFCVCVFQLDVSINSKVVLLVFQTDLYGLIGTVHVLLFGEYMNMRYGKSRWEQSTHFNQLVSFYRYRKVK